MIEEVRDYFLSCPAIKRRAKIFGINNLGPDALDYTVESVPGNPIVKRYTNGAAIRAKQFVIASRELHSVDAKTQARNSRRSTPCVHGSRSRTPRAIIRRSARGSPSKLSSIPPPICWA